MAYVREVVNSLDYEELLKIKKDIEQGGLHLRKLVDDKIMEKEREHKKFCSVCSSEIEQSSPNTYTLLFGPDDFKKRATFCAFDCLEYFLQKLKGMSEDKKEVDKGG